MKISAKVLKILILVLAVLLSGAIYYYIHMAAVSTDDAAIEGHVVTLSPKVQGYVKAIYINDNQLVKAGDVLLEVDPTDYIIRRDRAKAALTAARAAAGTSANNLAITTVTAPSSIDEASAQIAAAQASWDKSSTDRQRMENLFNAGACSHQQLDQTIATEKSDRAAVDQLRAKLRAANTAPSVIAAAQSTGEQLQAQVQQAEADLAEAETNLANTKIIAPMDGRITKRNVEIGTYVQTGQQLGVLVGTELWIVANFKENQLEYMRPGQQVDISVDAFPNVKFHGKVDSLQAGTGSRFALFPAENATGNFVKIVQRLPVKIVFTPMPEGNILLGPGMSVVPTVHTERT